MMLGTNMRSTACSQDFQVRPIWSWRWTRDNPPVPSFQCFQACTSSRKNNLALRLWKTRTPKKASSCASKALETWRIWDFSVSRMASAERSWLVCTRHSSSSCENTSTDSRLAGISWSTQWSQRTRILHQSKFCARDTVCIYIYIQRSCFGDFGNLPYQPAFLCAVEKLQKKNLVLDLYMICLASTLPLLALQGLPFVPGLLAATSPIHAGIALAPHASDEHLRRMVTLSLSFNNNHKTIRRHTMTYHNDMIYINKMYV